MHSVFHRFYNDAFLLVCDHPVKLCRWKLFTEGGSHKLHIGKHPPCFSHRSTLGKYPWNKFILRHLDKILICLCCFICICRIPHKVKSCHTQSLFISRIIIKRIISCYKRHSYESIMCFCFSCISEIELIISWGYGHLFPIGKLIVKSSSHIKILCLIRCCCTHRSTPLPYNNPANNLMKSCPRRRYALRPVRYCSVTSRHSFIVSSRSFLMDNTAGLSAIKHPFSK